MTDLCPALPAGYKSKLDLIETELAIKLVKDTFERQLAASLNLIRVSAPLFVRPSTGLNDTLSGVERPVSFGVPGLAGDLQIVQSLAKWKRMALHRYGFEAGRGLYTDMNAIRRDETLDCLHSIYVDQWDWELVIDRGDRNIAFLQKIVRKIMAALYLTQTLLCQSFPTLESVVSEDGVTFISSQELEDIYPELTPFERECEITKKYGTVFLSQIGANLRSGKPHDSRSPDYDDWSLNGDILVWNPLLERVFELSSMGIRVDAATLDAQLKISGCDDRREMSYHRLLLDGKLPLTIGGGIGQSRICMLLLQKAHIGEVQVSEWPAAMVDECSAQGIALL